MVHRPAWFRDGEVFVSYADTVGINKDGNALYSVDPATGKRTAAIDDKVAIDVKSLIKGTTTPTARWVAKADFSVAVPVYYNNVHTTALSELTLRTGYEDFEVRTLGDLINNGFITARAGHGSPPADMRDGTYPYIKVSDIRAGQMNINPTNMVPQVVAERFWRGEKSGLEPFDLITPVRASKNIGEFAIVMPGQEQVVVTKEVLIMRVTGKAPADNFYLLWALALKAVRDQWKRIVFMQTNREDVGKRYLEIEIPWPKNREAGEAHSAAFRDYYKGVVSLREDFMKSLEAEGEHYVFLGTSTRSSEEADAEDRAQE